MLLSDFLNMTKVLRMLYGVEVAKEYFEKQINEFGELNISDLFSYTSYDKVTSTTEK